MLGTRREHNNEIINIRSVRTYNSTKFSKSLKAPVSISLILLSCSSLENGEINIWYNIRIVLKYDFYY